MRLLLPGLLLLLSGCGFLFGPVSPLISAARSGDVAAIRSLAGQGANLDEVGGVNNWTPLMHAIHKDQLGSVRALLEVGANVNLHAGGTTALIMASGYGYADIVKELLKHGANPHAEARDGSTALDAAFGGSPDMDRNTVGQCQTETVKALLASDPGLGIKEDSDAFKTASKAGCKDEIALLEQ
jgi:Ankyrin repeats (3 copies)